VAVADGADAIVVAVAARTEQKPFDVAILDLHMPRIDGLRLGRALHSQPGLTTLPLVLLASSTDTDTWSEAKVVGFRACLNKPVRQSQLITVVSQALGFGTAKCLSALPSENATRYAARVLVAEDNQINQKVARLLLERLGCRVDAVGDGREAVEAVRRTIWFSWTVKCRNWTVMARLSRFVLRKLVQRVTRLSSR
jgi:two-component system, sensor histidine kinase and response regulator